MDPDLLSSENNLSLYNQQQIFYFTQGTKTENNTKMVSTYLMSAFQEYIQLLFSWNSETSSPEKVFKV